ncbi:hypothetical protein Tco_0167777 [Tanacetum coccineum]
MRALNALLSRCCMVGNVVLLFVGIRLVNVFLRVPEMIEVTNERSLSPGKSLRKAQTRQMSYDDRHRQSIRDFQIRVEQVFLNSIPTPGVRRFGIKGSLVLVSRTVEFLGSVDRKDRRHEEQDDPFVKISLEESSDAGSHLDFGILKEMRNKLENEFGLGFLYFFQGQWHANEYVVRIMKELLPSFFPSQLSVTEGTDGMELPFLSVRFPLDNHDLSAALYILSQDSPYYLQCYYIFQRAFMLSVFSFFFLIRQERVWVVTNAVGDLRILFDIILVSTGKATDVTMLIIRREPALRCLCNREIVSLDELEEIASFQDKCEHVGLKHKMIKNVKSRDVIRQGLDKIQ